ncbi:MAG: hypothetical protein ACLVEJ_08430 [Parabacteroides sp.]
MKVKDSTIPPGSLINKYLPANYSDSFECEIDSDKKITPDDIQISFWKICLIGLISFSNYAISW